MGAYINKINGKALPMKGKAKFIIDNVDGAIRTSETDMFSENIVCVVDNGMFEAAAYIYSNSELHAFAESDGRPKTWLSVPNASKLVD